MFSKYGDKFINPSLKSENEYLKSNILLLMQCLDNNKKIIGLMKEENEKYSITLLDKPSDDYFSILSDDTYYLVLLEEYTPITNYPLSKQDFRYIDILNKIGRAHV